jgi:N-acetylglucosaminyl-diphospho-decaprenol L-rhamnosyltransferase
MPIDVTYCIVNTQQRELLLRNLDAVARETAAVGFETEVLVLDNASEDGSAEAARAHPAVDDVIALERRTAKTENDSELLRRAKGRYGLLLNEDSELLPGATQALYEALEGRPRAAAAVAKLMRPDGRVQPSAWRFPGVRTAVVGALFLHRFDTVQSTGDEVREVDWAQSAALLVRTKAAAEVGWLDTGYFVYGEEVDFCRRLKDAGWSTLYVPAAEAIHHEQLSTGEVPERRIVEFSRNRERYLTQHESTPTRLTVRWLTAWAYALRAAAALVLPGHDPRRYWRHVTATLRPERGEGLREAAERRNRERGL